MALGKIARDARGSATARLGGHALALACATAVFFAVSAAAAPEQATQAAVARLAQTLEQDRTGLDSPAGLAFSGSSSSFYAVEKRPGGAASTDVARLTPFAASPVSDHAGSARLAAAVGDPINVAWDARGNRLLLLDNARRLLEVRANANGDLDASSLVRRDALRLGLRDPQGMTLDPARGTLFLLDAGPLRLLRLEPGADGSFDSASLSEVDLRASGLASARGLAFDPTSGNLQLGSGQSLHEVTTTGAPVTTRDLSDLGLSTPEGMAFAPSGDGTDASSVQSLYLADSGGARSSGQIVELALAPLPLAGPISFTSELVLTTNMGDPPPPTSFLPPSPDPSGIAYVSTTDRLIESDGEVEEVVSGITHFQGANVWEMNRDGSIVRTANISKVDWPAGTPSPTPMTDEPTGVAYKPSNGHYFFTEDGGKKVFDLNPGGDNLVGTSDDTWTSFSTSGFGNTDPEGIAYDSFSDRLVVADGANNEIFIYTTSGGYVSQFDTLQYGVQDPEAVEFNPVTGTLFSLSNRQSGRIIVETTTSGALLQTISVAASNAFKPAGLAYGPASDGSNVKRFYIVDRGIDNNNDPNIVDGKMYEMTAPASGPPTNAPPVVSAGADLNVTLPAAATLNGNVSDDGPVTTTWTQVSGPSVVTFQNASAVDTTASVTIPGVYVVRLTANDGEFTVSDEATLTFSGTGSVAFLDKPIEASSDDAEEETTGSMRLPNADLEMMIDPVGSANAAVGLRFTGLGIPQGATITYAYVQFESNTPSSDPTTLTIRAQVDDNAPTFEGTNGYITSLTTTSELATWSPDPWPLLGESGLAQRTSNLADVVQAIVDRPGWASSNALALIITGSGLRSAEAWDSNPAAAPSLHVEWTTGTNQAPVVDAGLPQTLSLPSSANLDGTVTDDNLPFPPSLTTTWSMFSGPGAVTFGNVNAVDTTATFSVDGTYVLQLHATDGALATTDTVTITVNPAGGPATLYFSVATAQTLSGLPVTPQDIVAFDGSGFSLYMDGSDVGLDSSSEVIDAFALLPGGNLLVSTTGSLAVPGLSGKDEDVIELAPTSLGAATAGTWSMYFDGSLFGLESSGEDVDAIEPASGNRLLISTAGVVSAGGVSGEDEDVLEFDRDTSTWAMYFDGSAVGLANSSEDVDGVALDAGGNVYLSTRGGFGVTGLSGADEDVFRCNGPTGAPITSCASFSLVFDGSLFGLAGNDLFAIDLP